MSEKLRVLSWNIQKFGHHKVNDPAFINYVTHVIVESGADFVGLMEIVGWIGQDVKNKLLATLNATGVNWDGAESEMTPSRPNEQYVLLWKKDPVVKCTVVTFGIVGEDDFVTFFAKDKQRWTLALQQQLLQLLLDKDVIDDDYIVSDAARKILIQDKQRLDLTLPKGGGIALSSSEKVQIVDILLVNDVIAFPFPGSRPPFVATLTLEVQTGLRPTLIAVLYHAPGPTGTWPALASNQLGLIPEVRDADLAVVMGDFNVKERELTSSYVLYTSDPTTGKLTEVLDNTRKLLVVPFQRLTGPQVAVSMINNNNICLTYERVLNSVNTSLVGRPPAATQIADDTSLDALQNHPYDNFYTIGFNATQIDRQQALPLINRIVPKYTPVNNPPNHQNNVTRSTTGEPYDPNGAQYAAELWNSWWDSQNAKGVKKPNIVKQFDKFQPNDTPETMRSAYVIYRNAVSDHLPIFIVLEYD